MREWRQLAQRLLKLTRLIKFEAPQLIVLGPLEA